MSKLEVPANWAAVQLGDVLEGIVGGGTPPKSNAAFFQGSIPLMTVKDMTHPRPSSTGFNITEEALENSSAKLIPADTVIIATRMGLGKVVRPVIDTAINQDLKALFPTPALDSSYLEKWLLSVAWKIEAMGTGTTVKGVRLNQIRGLDFPLAPLAEQRRIVEKIDTLFAELDKGEESLRQVQTLLARYRQSVLKAAVTGELTVDWRAERSGKLEGGHALLERILRSREDRWQGRGAYKEPRGPDTSRLRPLPKGWVWATLEQVGVVVSGHTPRGVGDLIALDGTFPWFKVSSMNELGNEVELCHSRWMFDDAGAKKAKLPVIPAGAIVFPKRGGAILTNKKRRMGCDGSIDLNLMAFVPSGIHGFIWAFFQLLDLRSIYDGSNVPQINYKDIAHIPIAIPSTEEEASVIAEIVDDQLVRIAELELTLKAELSRSAALRQSILKDAFSGRLVPQDPNDEPASELLARIRAARDDRKNR